MKIILLEQILIPFYRVEFFNLLSQKLEGDDLTILCGDATTSGDTKDASSHLPFVRKTKTHLYLSGMFFNVGGFLKYALKSDIVVCTFSLRNINFYIALMLSVIFWKKTFLFWGHLDGRNKAVSILRQIATRLGKGFICYTRTDAERLAQPFWGFKTRTTFLGNSLYSLAEYQMIKNLISSKPDIRANGFVYSGRLIHDKGLIELIEAYAEAVHRYRGIGKLHLIGDGDLRDCLAEKARLLGLGDNVVFHGKVTNINELANIYNAVSCSICCGYIGLNAIQSFAFGKPLIYQKGLNHSPEIEACIEGFNAFSYNSKTQLVNLLNQHGAKEVDSKLLNNIHKTAKENYNTDKMANRFAEFLAGASE